MHKEAPDASHKRMPKDGNTHGSAAWHLAPFIVKMLIQNHIFALLPENIFLQPMSLTGFTTSLSLLQLHMLSKTTYLKETGIILNLYSFLFKS